MGIQTPGGDNSAGGITSTLSEINITPFVDVMLVLLIIFMVTAPQLQQGFDVNVPIAAADSVEVEEDQVVVTVDRERRIFIGDVETPAEELIGRLQRTFANRVRKQVFIRADSQIPYGAVVEVLAASRRAGVSQIGMITVPPEYADPQKDVREGVQAQGTGAGG